MVEYVVIGLIVIVTFVGYLTLQERQWRRADQEERKQVKRIRERNNIMLEKDE
jgi:ABC-type cobalt transport system substrate-binding protein